MCGIGCVVTHWLQYNPHSTFLWDRCASLSLSPLKKSQKCVSQNQGSWGSRGGGRGWGSAQWDNCYKRHLSSQFPCVSLTTEIIKFWQLQFIFWHVFNMVSLSDCSFMWDIKRYSGYPLTSEISFFFPAKHILRRSSNPGSLESKSTKEDDTICTWEPGQTQLMLLLHHSDSGGNLHLFFPLSMTLPASSGTE